MRQIVLDGTTVNDDSDCYVIAEIGHNHQGSIKKALEMIKVAKNCGANAVKFQKRSNRTLFTKKLYNLPYENENSYGPTYGKHREALEFGIEEYRVLIDYAKEIDITLFATAFDFESVDFLANLDMPMYKIASADLQNTPLLKYIAAIGRPVILSTGGGDMNDILRAHETIMPINRQLCLLQCTAAYPIEEYEDMNLRVISTMRELFPDNVIGLSDHENGITMALVSYMLGARIIEKHFTLNRAWHGTDHAFSLSPNGLRRLTRDLHRTRIALGDGKKRRLKCEEKPLEKMSKKLVASRKLPAGHVLTEDDIAIKSPGDGLPPYEFERIIGKTVIRPLDEDDDILFDNLKGS
jgi:N-acetylneuraminate synthase/sialic acid synthase